MRVCAEGYENVFLAADALADAALLPHAALAAAFGAGGVPAALRRVACGGIAADDFSKATAVTILSWLESEAAAERASARTLGSARDGARAVAFLILPPADGDGHGDGGGHGHGDGDGDGDGDGEAAGEAAGEGEAVGEAAGAMPRDGASAGAGARAAAAATTPNGAARRSGGGSSGVLSA